MTSLLEETRKNIKSCLVAVGGTSTVELLQRDYETLCFDAIPHYKLGYSSTEALLRSLHDIVQVQGHGKSAVVKVIATSDSKSQHIQEMVAVQRKDKKFNERFQRSARKASFGNNHRQPWRPPPHHSSAPRPNVNQMPQQMQFRQQQQQMQYLPNNQAPFVAPQASSSAWVRQDPQPPPQEALQHPKVISTNKTQHTRPKGLPSDKPNVQFNGAKSPSVLRKTASPDRNDSAREWRTPSPVEKVTASTVSINRTARRSLDHDIIDWAAPIKNAEKVAPPPGYGDSPPIPETPLLEPPISMENDSEDEFSMKINQSIMRLENLNLSSISTRAMVSSDNSLPDEELMQEASGGSDPALPDWVYDTVQMVPKDMATYKDEIAFSAEHEQRALTINGWTEVFVSDMHNPHKFFFHLKDDIPQIDELMGLLDKFYERDSSTKLTPKPHELHPRLIVAALYNNLWHRGRVISEAFQLDKRPVCRIFFIDYGTVSTVPVVDIRFLHKKFLEKLQLCHRGSLSGILPYGESWTCEISKVFLAHVVERELFAMANFYYAPDRSWHVELVDPNTHPNVNINLELIKKNMARCYDSDDLEDYLEFYKSHPPTFDELISGKYPTYSELLEYHRLGIEYNPKGNANDEVVVEAEENEELRTEEVEENETLYLNENNPFIESLRAKKIRVVTRAPHDTTASTSSTENIFTNRPKKDIPMDNFNIPSDQKIQTQRLNPFNITFSDD